jgi:hypothetical protein
VVARNSDLHLQKGWSRARSGFLKRVVRADGNPNVMPLAEMHQIIPSLRLLIVA